MDSLAQLTREQLYEAVWDRPLYKLAEEHGVASGDVVKACTKLEVPRPTPGHWGRLRHGKASERPPLLPLGAKPPPHRHGQATVPGTRSPVGRVEEGEQEVPEPPALPRVRHPLIAQTGRVLRASKYRERGLVEALYQEPCLSVRVSPAQISRALGILQLVVQHLAKVGATLDLERPEGRAYRSVIRLGDASVGLVLREKVRVEKLTEKERRRRGFEFLGPRSDYHPTGRLVLKLDGLDGTRARQNWVGTASKPLECCLDDLHEHVVAAFKALDDAEIERARVAAEYAEAARLREERDAEVRRQRELVVFMLEMRRRWSAARELREFADALEATLPEELRDERTQDSLQLTREHADRLDPLASPEKLMEIFRRGQLRPLAAPSPMHGWSHEMPLLWID